MQQPGTLKFVPADGVTASSPARSTAAGPIVQDGPGKTIISGSGTFSAGMTISQRDAFLAGRRKPALLAGGLSVGGGALEFNTATVDSDCSGVISGTGGLNKSGVKKLTLSGSAGNTYGGDTNILQGYVDLNKTSGYAIPGNLNIVGPGVVHVRLLRDNQSRSFGHGKLFWNRIRILGIARPRADFGRHLRSLGNAFIENSDTESGDYSTGVLTIDSAANSSYKGCLRDNGGTGTGKLALVKNGAGTLTLSGNRCGIYTGGLTVNAGTLDYSSGVLPAGSYTITGGTLNTGAHSASIGTFQISGGTVAGTGTLTSSSAYDLQNGTVNVGLGGSAGLNKSGPGSVSLTRSLPGGNYTISGGTLNINALSQVASAPSKSPAAPSTAPARSPAAAAYDIQGGTVNAKLGGTSIASEQDRFRHGGSHRRQHLQRPDHGCVRDARIGTGGAERRVQPRRRRHPGGKDGLRLQRRQQSGGDDLGLVDRQLPRRSMGHRQVQGFDRGQHRTDAGLV